MIELTWKPSVEVSALHAAEAVCAGRTLIEPRLAADLSESAGEVEAFSRLGLFNRTRFWDAILGLAAQYGSNRALAEQVLRRMLPASQISPEQIVRLASRVSDVEAAHRSLFPKIAEQLPLRARPLQEVWEAFGPGLMRMIGKQTAADLIAPQAEVILVQPVMGGGGGAHIYCNRVRIEAVLTNSDSRFPEVVRLAWLLSQMQSELPKYSEKIHASRLQIISPLAMLPITLAAAQELELTTCSKENIAAAIDYWQILWASGADTTVIEPAQAIEPLLAWWETYQQTRPGWDIALTALDRMLSHQ